MDIVFKYEQLILRLLSVLWALPAGIEILSARSQPRPLSSETMTLAAVRSGQLRAWPCSVPQGPTDTSCTLKAHPVTRVVPPDG